MDEERKPVDVTNIFRAADAMTIVLRIGAPGDRTLTLTVAHAGDDDKAAPLLEREVKTKAKINYLWTVINFTNEPKLRGPLALRISLNGERLAEKQFRVD
jgi:hypothetical protein